MTDCARCATTFTPRLGGRPQRFCSRVCQTRTTNASAYRRHRDRRLARERLTAYGITAEQRAALEMDQKGLCAICGDRPPTRLCVDHDHVSGRIRGLLCQRCNLALGGFRDSGRLLTAALEYLTREKVTA